MRTLTRLTERHDAIEHTPTHSLDPDLATGDVCSKNCSTKYSGAKLVFAMESGQLEVVLL